jgi:hypothetical protein
MFYGKQRQVSVNCYVCAHCSFLRINGASYNGYCFFVRWKSITKLRPILRIDTIFDSRKGGNYRQEITSNSFELMREKLHGGQNRKHMEDLERYEQKQSDQQ